MSESRGEQVKIEWMRRFRPMEGLGSFTWYPLSPSGNEIYGYEIIYLYDAGKYVVTIGAGDAIIDNEYDTLEAAQERADHLISTAYGYQEA